jgi:hypothetical protein
MPAFQLKQFQQQIEQLLRYFALPTAFHQQLTHLFERYEQPSYRYGVGVKAPPEPAYHLQSQMLEELENELNRMAVERPRSALLLARECWTDRYYETRHVAAVVMGSAPLFDLALYQEIFLEMLGAANEEAYQLMLFNVAGKPLREEQFPLFVEMITDWLHHSSQSRQYAFSALLSLVNVGELSRVPTIFRLIEPFVIAGEANQQEEILHIMDGLVELSPMETAHFLSELTTHFYGEERMHYFRALCRSFGKSDRDFINRAFMDKSAFFHEEDIIDD